MYFLRPDYLCTHFISKRSVVLAGKPDRQSYFRIYKDSPIVSDNNQNASYILIDLLTKIPLNTILLTAQYDIEASDQTV